jgi:hypothetical protein
MRERDAIVAACAILIGGEDLSDRPGAQVPASLEFLQRAGCVSVGEELLAVSDGG